MQLGLDCKCGLVTGSPQEWRRASSNALHDTIPVETRIHISGLAALGRLGNVDDCFGACLFLAFDAMRRYLTGHIIDVNRGWFMS